MPVVAAVRSISKAITLIRVRDSTCLHVHIIIITLLTWGTTKKVFTDCIFSHNRATQINVGGGGIFAQSHANPEFYNVSFYDNTAITYGGAILLASASGIFQNCTIRNNEQKDAGNGHYSYGGGGGVLITGYSNSIFRTCKWMGNIARGPAGGGGLMAFAPG